jgi:hypothetical protein
LPNSSAPNSTKVLGVGLSGLPFFVGVACSVSLARWTGLDGFAGLAGFRVLLGID